ncbi:zinc ABC transporter substrate-binding protein [Leptolyngbya sp. FACHB-541]|uniref:metal ABC transporter solute-binding protein, Zn/Mn family n=1 Tax=Leptolyngbya sp. FACHB-541 TaxID=2692810 RepID=UPI001688C227|nr:zinc ABC transporter substrate-binding protein [Leptolyngbya sp. FACHB-541]MBD1996743.1 zinc ABC transporter substrate-binding protein [Leptolyngbya sp. FACHB-541]
MKMRKARTRALAHPLLRPSSLRVWAIAALFLGLTTSGCNLTNSNSDSSSAADAPEVVATSTILADLTEQIGESEIQLTSILEPGADPHVYEPVPADTVALERADLILYNGYNLEPGLIRLTNSAGVEAKKVAVGEVAPSLEVEGQSTPDPHVWGDVQNVILMVNAIRDALIEVSESDRPTFEHNAAELVAELERLDAWIAQQIATIPPDNRRLVTTHDAFQYYARAYSLNVIGTLIGISTEEQPSAQTVQRLVESVRATGVPTIFAETTINPALIQTVAEEAEVDLSPQQLYSDSIGAPGGDGDSYVKMMVSNTRAIVEALGGTYTPFE